MAGSQSEGDCHLSGTVTITRHSEYVGEARLGEAGVTVPVLIPQSLSLKNVCIPCQRTPAGACAVASKHF
jgi:hypothetical protein